MWQKLCIVFAIVTNACSQHADSRVEQGEGRFVWGWQMQPHEQGAASVGHYFVKLPQSEQHVSYAADGSGYHGALGLNTTDGETVHTANFALGQRALELNQQQIQPQEYIQQQNRPVNDIYLLQKQYSTEKSEQNVQLVPNTARSLLKNYYITPLYNIQTHHPIQNTYVNERHDYKEQQKEEVGVHNDRVLTTPIVQVFKDANCSKDDDDEENIRKEFEAHAEKPDYIDTSNFDVSDLNGNFGKRVNKSLTYKGKVHFTVESPKAADRSERFYYTAAVTPMTSAVVNVTHGFDKLVASTQDLISSEDLLVINHAAEKHVNDLSEDFIKPRPRYSVKQKTDSDQPITEQITIKAKFGSLSDNQDTNRQHYDFATPIIVADSTYPSQNQQIVNNLHSTMVPYIQEGYELVGVRHSLEENDTNSDSNLVNVTPRPISQNYLAPITVALRLLNANDNNNTFDVDDHETSDSELVPDTVASPSKETTIVEIQESPAVDITHINDVEVHEYMEDGRSNDVPYNFAKSLYYKYIDALKSSKQIQDNMSKILYKYGAANDFENIDEKNNITDDSSENFDSNEAESKEVEPEQAGSQRTEYVKYLNKFENHNRKLIQPIIIEKEVPVTKFVDRYIEKEVRVPETVQVPVDRPVPVAVPVEKIVEKPVEVTKYVDRPYPVEVPQPYAVGVEVPYPVEQKIYIDRPVHVPYPIEKIVEKPVLHPIPVPTPVGVPVEVPVPVEHKVIFPIAVEKQVPFRVDVEKPVYIDHIIEKQIPIPYTIEKQIHVPVPYEKKVPVPYPVEKRVHVPVDRIVEKPVTVTKYVEKPIHIQVPVPQPIAVPVHVPQPYPVEKIVEKKVPYPVDRLVEKQIQVQVPFPVEKLVEKIVTKYVDKPYPVEKRIPYPVQVPFEVKVPYPVEKIVNRPVPVALYKMYDGQESKYHPQYYMSHYNQNSKKSDQSFLSQYQQYLKDRQRILETQHRNYSNNNKYPTSFQYTNNTLNTNYLSNSQNGFFLYYPPNQNQNLQQKNKNYVLEVKLRRADRVPKMTQLRIEYGGFKPPLIPSTEIDLDGIPVKDE